MKKILQIVDVPDWAIGHLAKAISERNNRYQIKTISVHPKAIERNEVNIEEIKADVLWSDLVDFQYWRTASQLIELIPELKDKKTILTHQNDKDLLSADWSSLNKIIARTKYAFDILSEKYPGKVELIPIGIDLKSFPWHGQDPEKLMVGYVGRVVPWKGLKEVARACFELEVPLLVMGKMDKPSYWEEIPQEHKNNMVLDYFDCEDDERLEAYRKMTVYVGNSGPGRESGTMGYMEAMAVGVPVVTTPAGMASDYGVDHENCLMVPFGDYEKLKSAIKEMLDFKALRDKCRSGGWETVKGLNWDRMALAYGKLYNAVLFPDQKLVSVIIPTTIDRIINVSEILSSLERQTYKNIEALVVFDETLEVMSNVTILERLVKELSCFDLPVSFWATCRSGYNLARARNMGIINAYGSILVFCDSRMKPDADAVEQFVNKLNPDEDELQWLFGEKGGGKKTFVENFSCIKRKQIINAGMFNEVIDQYGGMSQELRERFMSQGFAFPYVPEAKATQMIKSSTSNPERKKQIIEMKNLLFKLGLY